MINQVHTIWYGYRMWTWTNTNFYTKVLMAIVACLFFYLIYIYYNKQNSTLQWLYNEHDGVTNNRYFDCLLNRFFRRRAKKTSKLRVTGLCEGNSPVTDEFPAQKASNAGNVAIWWRHHEQRRPPPRLNCRTWTGRAMRETVKRKCFRMFLLSWKVNENAFMRLPVILLTDIIPPNSWNP